MPMSDSTNPWLTVITVVKNDIDGFRRTLDSLRAQDLTDVEFIVVDSSQDQEAIPRALAAAGFPARVVWVSPEGIFPAMNEGLRFASGIYVQFLNAGDELADPDVIAVLRQSARSAEPVWLFGDVEIVNSDETVVHTPSWSYEQEKAAGFARGLFPQHQATLARREALLADGGFDTSLLITADYALFLRLSQRSSPLRVPFTIARFREGGISTDRWVRMLREFHTSRRAILQPQGRAAWAERWLTFRQFMLMSAYRSPWPLAGFLAAFVIIVMGATGVSWGSAIALTAFVAIQSLGGLLWWRLLTPKRRIPILEGIGMGIGIGTAAAMLIGLFAPWWIAPLLAVAAWFIRTRLLRRTVAPMAPLPRWDGIALLAGLVLGLAAFLVAIRNYPLQWIGAWRGYHGDMPFFEALAASVAQWGPLTSIFMSDEDIRYHSFAYAWAGQLTLTTDAAPFVVLTRLLPLVTTIGVLMIAIGWARHLSSQRWVPALAAILLITGGFVGATYGGILNFDSPSQSLGAVWILAVTVVLMQSLNGAAFTWHLVVIGVLMIALTGGKVSTAAVAASGFGLVLIVGLIRKEPWRWRALLISVVGLVAMGGVYWLLLAGSANAGGLRLFTFLDRASSVQSLNPVITPRGIAAGIALLVLAILPRWAGLGWLVGSRHDRWRPETIYGVGLVLGGIGALVTLSGGFNDLWFAVAASAPLSVLSAVGVGLAAAAIGQRHPIVLAAIWGFIASLLVAAVWTTGTTGIIGQGWRWAGPILGFALAIIGASILASRTPGRRQQVFVASSIVILVALALPSRLIYAVAEPYARAYTGTMSLVLFAPKEPFMTTRDLDPFPAISSTQLEAGSWLRANTAPDDIIATNITLSATVPALSRRTTYISDIHMQAPYGDLGDLPAIAQRESESWEFINAPSQDSAQPLCRGGVRWVWVDRQKTSTETWEPFGEVVWIGEDTILLRLQPSAC